MTLTDPVCGMTFTREEAGSLGAEEVVHAGGSFFFCCPTCKKEFLADPAKFV